MFFVNILYFGSIYYFSSILYLLHRYIIFSDDMLFSFPSYYISRQIIFSLDMFYLDMSLLDMSFLDIEYITFPASSISKFYFLHKNGTSNRIVRSEMPFLFSLLANSSFVNRYIILQCLLILL